MHEVGESARLPRVIGDFDQGEFGPLLILVAGVHGNEPAGVEALARFCAEMRERDVPLRGRVLALAGNLAGLAAQRRFIDKDLNRTWLPARIDELAAGGAPRCSEEREMLELMELLNGVLHADWESVTMLDLHSTSGEGPAFAILTDNPPARTLARALGVPAVLGLHKNVPGTLIDWFESLGHTSVVLEGGQNAAAQTRERHAAAAWVALEVLGLVDPGALDLREQRTTLADSTAHLPPTVDVCLRWGIDHGERFRMEPGFANMQEVHRGQLLAHGGRHGEVPILAPFDGLLVMPLYQEQGSDGFFLGLPPHAWGSAQSQRA